MAPAARLDEIIASTVEHPCSRCGAAVDDNSAFCPECEAPQIRFGGREPSSVPRATIPEPVPAATSFRQQSEADRYEFWRGAQPESKPADSRAFLRSAVYAGIIGAILSALPFGFVFALPLAGVLSVVFYKKRAKLNELPPSRGLRLGTLAGLCAFGAFLVLFAIEIKATHQGPELRQAMVDRIHHAQAMNPDPHAQKMLAYFLTSQGMVVMIVTGFLFMGIVFVLLAGVGGTISAAFSRRAPPRR